MPQIPSDTRSVGTPERQRPKLGLGERVRQRRVALGLTQTDLAGVRFSKEYISQIELGKTRPTPETIDYLSSRLSIDPGYLAHGVSTEDQTRVEAMLTRAEALAGAHDFEEALVLFTDATTAVAATGSGELAARRLLGQGWALMEQGQVREGLDILTQAREVVDENELDDALRAEALFKLGVARVKLGSTHVAITLLSEAHKLLERSSLASDSLRAQVLAYRAAAYQRVGDVEAAREDAERAVELAEQLGDSRVIGASYMQASLIAEREGRFVLARNYAERAKAKYEEVEDEVQLGKVLNNLGLCQALLGKYEDALGSLTRAYGIFLELGDNYGSGHVVSSIASLHLETGDPVRAEEQARLAIQLIGDGEDDPEQDGEAKLVLGKALLAQGRLDEAEETLAPIKEFFESMRATSNLSRTLIALGDLAVARDTQDEAAALYRRAAEIMQDLRI
ncbi:MAG: tetratricopeptide repeat protein [Gaiellaceae bacterium]|jgi:tetratricopeptide (TPR) repeat protein